MKFLSKVMLTLGALGAISACDADKKKGYPDHGVYYYDTSEPFCPDKVANNNSKASYDLNQSANQMTMLGVGVGNGGLITICQKAPTDPLSYTVLDYFEAKEIHNLDLNLGEADQEPEAKVRMVIERIRKHDGLRADLLTKTLEEFIATTTFLDENYELPSTGDTGDVILPNYCQLLQIAIQRPPKFPKDKSFFVSRKYWDLLDSDNKAGLILHEIIYREAIGFGQDNSSNVRALNALVSSKDFSSLSTQDYAEAMLSLGFPPIKKVGNIIILIGSDTYFEGIEQLKEAVLARDYQISDSLVLAKNEPIRFYSNGHVTEGTLAKDTKGACGETLVAAGSIVTFNNYGSIIMSDGK